MLAVRLRRESQIERKAKRSYFIWKQLWSSYTVLSHGGDVAKVMRACWITTGDEV